MKRLFDKDTKSLTTLGFGLALTLSMFVILAVLWQLNQWNAEAFSLIRKIDLEAEKTYEMRDRFRRKEISMQHILNSIDSIDKNKARVKFTAYAAEFEQARKQLSKVPMTAEIKALHVSLKNIVDESQFYNEKLVELLSVEKNISQSVQAAIQQREISTQKITSLLDRLTQLQHDRHEKFLTTYENSYSKFSIFSIAIYAFSLAVAVFIVRRSNTRYKYISRLSIIDEVTNSYNRLYFDMVMEEEWKRSMREYTPISLVMLDVDYFKPYNDKFGNETGGTCLFSVAKIIASQLKRSSDFIARYGDNEFVVVLPNTNADNARIMAERLRRSVEEGRIQAANDTVSPWVTVSVGVVTTTAEYEQCSSIIMHAADQALDKSKHDGRNRVTEVNLANVD